jgi:hypothetical protein
MFIITKETADAYRKVSTTPGGPVAAAAPPGTAVPGPSAPAGAEAVQPSLPFRSGEEIGPVSGAPQSKQGITWSGAIPPQKWMNFYTKVLTKLGVSTGLTLTVKVESRPEGGLSPQKMEEVKSALRELGLTDKID